MDTLTREQWSKMKQIRIMPDNQSELDKLKQVIAPKTNDSALGNEAMRVGLAVLSARHKKELKDVAA